MLRPVLLLIYVITLVGAVQWEPQSDFIEHIVENIKITHLHDLSDFKGGIRDSGIHQPRSDVVKVSFTTKGSFYEYQVHAETNLHSPDAEIILHGKAIETKRPVLLTYSSRRHRLNPFERQVFTFHSDDLITGSVFTKDPSRTFTLELREAVTGKVVVSVWNQEYVREKPKHHLRKLLQFPDESYRWDDCFPLQNEDEPHSLTMGLVMDLGFYKFALTRNSENPSAFIDEVVATANLVFQPQVGITLQIAQLIMKTELDDDLWNQDPSSDDGCSWNITDNLALFRSWRNTVQDESRFGIWHLFTNCYPYGSVGIAYVGSICHTEYNVAISSRLGTGGSSTWLVFSHEVGHNLNASHSFENGEGTTGGIMDYGDGTLNNVYQFNTQYRRDEMCSKISQTMAASTFQVDDCWNLCGDFCEIYVWQIASEWSGCDFGCGVSGQSTRSVVCIEEKSSTVSNDSLCDSSVKPNDVIQCVLEPCSSDNCSCSDWTAFSFCLENGIETRTRFCSPVDVCFDEGFSLNDSRICNYYDIDVTEQTCLHLNRLTSTISSLPALREELEFYLPIWLELNLYTFTVTDISILDNDSLIVRFYAVEPLFMVFDHPFHVKSGEQSGRRLAPQDVIEFKVSQLSQGTDGIAADFIGIGCESPALEEEKKSSTTPPNTGAVFAVVGGCIALFVFGTTAFFFCKFKPHKEHDSKVQKQDNHASEIIPYEGESDICATVNGKQNTIPDPHETELMWKMEDEDEFSPRSIRHSIFHSE